MHTGVIDPKIDPTPCKPPLLMSPKNDMCMPKIMVAHDPSMTKKFVGAISAGISASSEIGPASQKGGLL